MLAELSTSLKPCNMDMCSSRPGSAGLRNYRRRELQLLSSTSDDWESQSLESERDHEDPLSDGASDQEVSFMEGEMAGRGPDQDHLDET